MLQISIKKVIWIGVLITLIILFFLSLWLSSRKQTRFLESQNRVLQAKLEASQEACEQVKEQNYYLCDAVKCVSDGLNVQTRSINILTKSLPKTNWVPIIIKDTVWRDGDALSPFRSPKDTTKSRGF
jgi:uncharacterized protein YpmB